MSQSNQPVVDLSEALRNPTSENLFNALRDQVATAMTSPDPERMYDISLGDLVVREHHKGDREFSKVMLRVPGVSWPTSNYGTVVAVQLAVTEMLQKLNSLGVARLNTPSGSGSGPAAGGVVPAPRPRTTQG